MDIESGSAQMVFNDVDQSREQEFECVVIVGLFYIPIESVEKPKGRICGIISTFLRDIGKHVRNQTVPDIMGESVQDVTSFQPATGQKRQTFQADHGVAAPIGKPMISGDDGARFVA